MERMRNRPHYREPVQNVVIAIVMPWLLFFLVVGFLCCKHWGSN